MIIVTIENIKVQVISSAGSLNVGKTVNIQLATGDDEEIVPQPVIPTPPQPIVNSIQPTIPPIHD